MIIFPDTNLFIHFRDPNQLEWSDIVQADTIELAVGRAVQKELQRTRFELRGRSQERARRYAKLLGDIAQSGKPAVLREAAPRVELVLMARPRGWSPPPDLAEDWGDDQLVADALAYLSNHLSAEMAVLSDDAEVIAAAHTHGIRVLRPPQSWELPPETTPEAKELARAKKELEELRHNEPAVECEILDDLGQPISALLPSATWRPPLEADEADALIQETVAAHPRAETFNHLGNGSLADEADWIIPSDAESAAYYESYNEWCRELAAHVNRVGSISDARGERVRFQLALRNVGSRPAERVRLTLDLQGGFTFRHEPPSDDERQEDDTLSGTGPAIELFRVPPLPPRPKRRPPASSRSQENLLVGRNLLGLDFTKRVALIETGLGPRGNLGQLMEQATILGRLAPQVGELVKHASPQVVSTFGEPDKLPLVSGSLLSSLPMPPDRNKFYFRTRRDERDGVTCWEFECEAFQHGDEDVLMPLTIEAQVGATGKVVGELRVRVLADNLRRPFEKAFSVRLLVERADPIAFVRKTLPRRRQ